MAVIGTAVAQFRADDTQYAAGVRRMRGHNKDFFDEVRSMFGRGSALHDVLGVALGTGIAAGLGEASRVFKELGANVSKMAIELDEGKASAGDMADHIASTLPVVGGVYDGLKSIIGTLSGINQEIARTTAETKALDDQTEAMKKHAAEIAKTSAAGQKQIAEALFQQSIMDMSPKQKAEAEAQHKFALEVAADQQKTQSDITNDPLIKNLKDRIAAIRTEMHKGFTPATGEIPGFGSFFADPRVKPAAKQQEEYNLDQQKKQNRIDDLQRQIANAAQDHYKSAAAISTPLDIISWQNEMHDSIKDKSATIIGWIKETSAEELKAERERQEALAKMAQDAAAHAKELQRGLDVGARNWQEFLTKGARFINEILTPKSGGRQYAAAEEFNGGVATGGSEEAQKKTSENTTRLQQDVQYLRQNIAPIVQNLSFGVVDIL